MRLSTTAFLVLLSSVTTTLAWLPAQYSARPMTTTLATASLKTTDTTTTTTTTSPLEPAFAAALDAAQSKLKATIPEAYHEKMLPLLAHFVSEYMAASQQAYGAGNEQECRPDVVAGRVLTAISYGLQYGTGDHKYQFDVSHNGLRGDAATEEGNEVDFYAFGCDFFRPVMDLAQSEFQGLEHMEQIKEQLAAGENVVLFANHQSEADPQVVSAGLEVCGYAEQAEQMVYVAGHKVTTDPLAVPFSMGRNLICIHSKKHIDVDPESKPMKQRQNMRAIGSMLERLKAGGCLLWVAPSGGRDRRDLETGTVPIAPFDSKTIDIFRLMGNKSKVPTHYYSLAMVSYELCPPPDYLVPGTGEPRNVRFSPIGLKFSPELESVGGLEKRQAFCAAAFDECQTAYNDLLTAIAAKVQQE